MTEPTSSSIVSLNEVSMLLKALTSGELRAGLTGARLVADCDVRCGCNTRDCGCHGSVSSRFIEEVSDAEFQRMRQQRIEELKTQLARLESTT